MKKANIANVDKSHVAKNVGAKSINDILVEQVIESLHSRYTLLSIRILIMFVLVHLRPNGLRVSALTNRVRCTCELALRLV